MTAVTIAQVELAVGDRASEAWLDVHHRANVATWGQNAQRTTVAEVVEVTTRRPERRATFAATSPNGCVVGAAQVIVQLRENTDTGGIWLSVDPEHVRRGIGTALLATAEGSLRSAGCRRVHEHSGAPVKEGDPAMRFAIASGYRQTLLDLRHDLVLPVAEKTLRRLEPALDASAYVVQTAHDGVPAEWLDDRALLARRMSTDAPMGDIDLDVQDWDVERVVRQRNSGMPGRRTIEAVARHVGSRRLVGFSEIDVAAGAPELAVQGDTLVLREHRGQALGLAMKVANLRLLQQVVPVVTTVRTWNADSNHPMLAINRALGFAVTGWTREWTKDL